MRGYNLSRFLSCRLARLLAAACLAGSGQGTGPAHVVQAATLADPVLEVTVIQDSVENAWDIAFTPDGRMLVSERRLGISIFGSAEPGAPRLALVPIDGLHAAGEAGVMGLAIDPGFAGNGFLYVCVSRDDEGEWRNQILRYVVGADTLTLDGFVVRSGMLAETIHDGCRLRFGPDAKLWATMGDNPDPMLAQDPFSLHGKILRMNPDGSVPADNPIMPGTTMPSLVFTMGHRNPQGLAFQPGTGRTFSMELAHHQISPTEEEHDTVNILRPGGNYGWPLVAGPGSGFDQPAWGSGDGVTYAVSGGAFVTGANWGDWSGHLFVGALAGQQLLHFSVGGATVTRLPSLLSGTNGRLRAPVFGPDGALYLTTDNGAPEDVILRITAASPGPGGSSRR